MNESLEIPVIYNGREFSFKAKLVQFGYIHKIEVQLNDHVVFLEPDEEGKYRASLDPVKENSLTADEGGLLKEIIAVLEKL